MFAFALWNNKEEELFIARDRFGEKPLYYHADFIQRGRFEQFVFASEMKALWQIGVPKTFRRHHDAKLSCTWLYSKSNKENGNIFQ